MHRKVSRRHGFQGAGLQVVLTTLLLVKDNISNSCFLYCFLYTFYVLPIMWDICDTLLDVYYICCEVGKLLHVVYYKFDNQFALKQFNNFMYRSFK